MGETMDYITRISYNTVDWRRPNGDAAKYEQRGSYNQKFGFGHEDWLFREEWLIDGWRYAFLQGVGKSTNRLRKAGTPFNVRLFCIDSDKRRRYVADIGQVECLGERQAEDALRSYRKLGWLSTMKEEIRRAKGEAAALGNADYASHILNVRYRPDSVTRFPPNTFASSQDPVLRYSRYSLVGVEGAKAKFLKKRNGRAGSDLPPSLKPVVRVQNASTREVSRTHALMQARLMAELQAQYPGQVRREENCIDVTVRTPKQRILFEIKSSTSPSSTLRQALGQLLEYLYRDGVDPTRETTLVVVGQTALDEADRNYLRWLRAHLKVDLSYRVVEIAPTRP